MANILDCYTVVNEFEFQSCYNVHFWINTFRKGMNSLIPDVIYWQSTEPSIKSFTCVNKRKNSGSKWTLNNNITRCPGRLESVGDKMPKWEPVADRELWALCDTRLSNPSQDEAKEVLLWSDELGVNIAVCHCLQLISHTQQPSPFRE